VAQKVGYSNFKSIMGAFIVFCIVGFIIQLAVGGAWIVWIPLIFSFCFALGLRLFIVTKENITECGSSPCFGEFCVGFWCWYCSVAQSKPFALTFSSFFLFSLVLYFFFLVARHVYGYSKVLDGDGDPLRPDQYTPVQNV
jgi:hypothetical protein